MISPLVVVAALLVPQSPAMSNGAVLLTRTTVPKMGFFDDLKKGFENDDRLQNIPDKTASGKTRNTAAYVKQKTQAKAAYEAKASARSGKKQADESDDKMAEFLGKFKW